MVGSLNRIMSELNLSTLSIPSFRITDIVDIGLVAFLIYVIMIWIKETRAWSLFKGIAIIFVVSIVSYQLHFYTISWIIEKTLSVGIIALIVLFQPEFRKGLEQIGKGNIVSNIFNNDEEGKILQKTIKEVVTASSKMAKVRTGALILIEQDVPLGDLEMTGIPIDAIVTSQLLINIFENKTPLHDGAVIIRNNRVAAATCILPLTQREIGLELGTRHRAAVGASEESDAFIIVVSEETGSISVAHSGKLYRNLSESDITKMISKGIKPTYKGIKLWKERKRNAKKISNVLFKYISKNFGWKLFSIVCAVVLWFIVMNIINPTEIQTYSVNITFLNEDKLTEKGFVVMNKDEMLNTKIEIKVKSTRAALDELNKNEKDITATVDLKQFAMLYADDVNESFKVAVTPNIPNSYVYTYELVNFTPGEISVKLDNIVETQKNVVIDSEGEIPNGYLAGEPSIEPSSVKIKGASSQIAALDSVKVSVDMSDVSEDVVKNFKPIAYDKDGNEISSLIIEPDTVKVSFGVYKYGQITVEKPEIEGFAAPNYMITGVDWEPKYIEVVGDENEIADIASIKPKVKLNGQNDDKIVLNYDVNAHIAKNKISIKEGTKKEVTVTITLEKEEFKDFSIDRDNISTSGLNSDFMVILPAEIKVKLKGSKDNLDNIEIGDINASFNLSNFSEGTHSVEAIISLPEGVSLTEKIYSQIKIVKYSSNETINTDNNNSNTENNNTDNNSNNSNNDNNIENNNISENTTEVENTTISESDNINESSTNENNSNNSEIEQSS